MALAEDEFNMHKKLLVFKVETPAEFRQQESIYLGKKERIIQAQSNITNSQININTREKEIFEFESQIKEHNARFFQAINSLISNIEEWKSKYVIYAPQVGIISFVGLIQQNQFIADKQKIFNITPQNNNFFGEMTINEKNIGKILVGQQVLIKLHSFPFEEYGFLKGKVESVSEVPINDSVFTSRILILGQNQSDTRQRIRLRQGLLAEGNIVIQNATMLQRLFRSTYRLSKTY